MAKSGRNKPRTTGNRRTDQRTNEILKALGITALTMLPVGAAIRGGMLIYKGLKGARALSAARKAIQAKKTVSPAPKRVSNKPSNDVIEGTAVVKSSRALPKPKNSGTSVVPLGSRAVKNPGTGVQRVVRMKDKPKEMKQAQRADRRVTGSAAKPKKKSKALRNTAIAAAALGGGYLATRDGDKTTSASTPTKPTPKKVSTPKSRPTRKNLGTVTARKVTPQKDAPAKKKPEAKKAAPSKVISAGPNTGFGPKGNIFPGNAEERAGYMKMYGGTGSAAARAAAAGKQGDMKAGRAAVDAAKKKRLSKKKD